MKEIKRLSSPIRFGIFEVDLQAGELRRQGLKVKLQEQPFQVLTMLLERPGQVLTREEVQKKLWPADTFVDFERGLNRAINKLREALVDDADSPRFIETLPRRGYRFLAPVETVRTDCLGSAGENSRQYTSLRRSWLTASAAGLLTILLLCIGLNVGGMRERLLRQRADPRIESIAVLPLQNLSSDPAQEYFADGMTDELIGEIAKIGSLRVISRTSSMLYKSAGKSLPVIARELGVDAVVEGTVLRSGQKVRITAQLIRARDDQHLWSETYERDLGDVLRLQSEVAQAIAGRIQLKLTPQEQASLGRTRRVNPQAYEAYLEGSHFRNKVFEDSLKKSIEFFTKAIALDPGYAEAYAGLSETYCFFAIHGIRPPGESYTKARAAAMKALELDETVAEAHVALADVKKGYDWDWGGAEAEYKRALQLNPSYSLGHYLYADLLSKMKRHDEAIAQAKRARELDPISAGARAFLGYTLYRARKYEEALQECRTAVELDPSRPVSLWFLALVRLEKREFAVAIADLEKAAILGGNGTFYRAVLGYAYMQDGQRAKALKVLSELKTRSKRAYVSPFDIAIVYTGLGDPNAAFQWLEKAYQERTMRIQELPQPIFDSLRSDPRFRDLTQRLGLAL